MKRLTIALALLTATSVAAQNMAQPGFTAVKQRPCLTADEARGLATFVLPGLVEGLADRCRGSLARDAFLRRPETASLSERLRRDGAASWPVAKASIEKLNGDRLPSLFGERFIKAMAEATAADLTLKQFDKADCGAASQLVEGLAPLPSANFSSVIAALIALGGDEADADAPLRICPAAVAAR